nr:HNH endonuclease [Oceanococcus sp. HetDA_MAG_MS8]
MHALPRVLKLSAGGMPVAWVDWQRAVCLYMENKILWEAGAEPIILHGGWNRESGQRSVFELSPIIAVDDRSRIWEQGGVFPLTRRRLIARDHALCLYCGRSVSDSTMTIDHVKPRGQGGRHTWENVVSSCRSCNQKKGCRTPEQASMDLLAVPYAPNVAEILLLSGRHVLADQMDYLEKFVQKRPGAVGH